MTTDWTLFSLSDIEIGAPAPARHASFLTLLEDMRATYIHKNADYAGDSGSVYSNFEFAAAVAEPFTDPVDKVFAAIIGIGLAASRRDIRVQVILSQFELSRKSILNGIKFIEVVLPLKFYALIPNIADFDHGVAI